MFRFSRLVGGAAPAARSRQKFHVCSYAEEITHPQISNHWQPSQFGPRKKRHRQSRGFTERSAAGDRPASKATVRSEETGGFRVQKQRAMWLPAQK